MRYLIISFLLFCSSIGNSQDYIDLFNAEYQNTPLNDFKEDSSGTGVQGVSINALAPIKINSKFAILADFTYDHTRLKYDPIGTEINAIGFSFKAGANINHNDKWSGTYVVIPKWASNENKMESKNFQLGAATILKYKKSENLKYIFGAYYNKEFFGPFTTPLFGFYYKKNRLEAHVMLPAVTDINYEIAKNTSLGFHFRSIAKSYNFSSSSADLEENYIVQMSNELSLYLGKKICNSILIKAYLGHSIGRSYRVYSQGDKMDLGLSAFRIGDDRLQLNKDFKNGLYFRFGLTYRYSLKE